MKILKALFLTIISSIVLIIIIPLIIVMLIYSPNSELPEEYSYINNQSDMYIEDYFNELDIEKMSEIVIKEEDINIIFNTYMSLDKTLKQEYGINYLYVDLKEQGFNIVGHSSISEFKDFPIKINISANVEYDGKSMFSIKLKRIKVGLIPLPNWLIKYTLKHLEEEEAYLNIDDLSIDIDMDEYNPYFKIIGIREIYINEKEIHINMGFVSGLGQEINKIVKSHEDIFIESIEDVYEKLNDEEKLSADKILKSINENKGLDISDIDVNEGMEIIDEFMKLNSQAQDTIIDSVKKNMSDEELTELLKIYNEYINK